MSYKRTGTISVTDIADTYEIPISEGTLVQSRNEHRHFQIVRLPDEHNRYERQIEGDVHELTVRDPLRLKAESNAKGISPVVERDGPYEMSVVLRRTLDRAKTEKLPLYDKIVELRPDDWSASAVWTDCPECSAGEVTLVTDLDSAGMTLACRRCDARVSSEQRERLFREWLHCPSCESGDVNIELSAPSGRTHWSCDDCLYDTVPGPVDIGYTRARKD